MTAVAKARWPKVMTIVGTRPEIIRLSRVIAELEASVLHVLVHTGQNYDYELNGIFFDELQIRRPDHFLNAAGKTSAETIGNVIARADAVLEQEQPDALLLLGDTNSCLSAIAAKRRKIPIFHMEAGNRCFDQRVPEETNRKIVDHISDINLTYTEHARRYLLAEGLPSDRIIKTGSPMREVLNHYAPLIERSSVLDNLELRPHEYFVVSAHREENVDPPDSLARLVEVLNAIAATFGWPVVVSTHPRTRKRLQALGDAIRLHDGVRLLKPLGFPDYVRLQQQAFCVVSDSGTITEESSILRFPAVTIREAHERPEGMDEGALIMAGLCRETVLRAIEIVTAHRSMHRHPSPVADYDAEDVSLKVVRIIVSYIGYVHRRVWQRTSHAESSKPNLSDSLMASELDRFQQAPGRAIV
jgi:UDP-N-acetylglucosamine 2-epimerase (non-hydrolysing)